jgi:hypothetical protein
LEGLGLLVGQRTPPNCGEGQDNPQC